MKRIEPPRFLIDLYRDLRDRRLLLPGLVLIVALVAVPVGLSSSASTLPPPSAAAPVASKATSAQPAVLAQSTGIRSYRSRLAALKSKNPFQRHFKLPKVKGGNPGALTPPATSTSPPPPVSAPPPPTSTPASGGSSPTVTTTTTPTTVTTTRTITVTKPAPKPVKHFYEYVADVRVGVHGQLAKRNGVRQLTVLPVQSHPVIVYLGQTTGGKAAAFSVSNDVASVDGDGTCIPSPASCRYLTMKPGDAETFAYTPDGKTYGLKIVGFRRVEVSGHHQAHRQTGRLPSATELKPGPGTGK
jgi:hypothetical protein